MWHYLRALFQISLRQPAFAVRIERQQAAVFSGQVPQAFVKACQEVVEREQIAQGLIMGLNRPQGIRLEFSKAIPESARQPLRNLWQMYS